MTTTRHGSRGALTFLTAAFVLLVACLLSPPAARAQWTPPDASNNISNTNTGNVGINITVPSFKFEVRGSTSRTTASFTGDGDSVGYAGIRIAAFTTTGIANNRAAAYQLSMRKDTWYGGDGSGPSFIIETGTKGFGFAAPFVITPTNDILLNSGRGAGGPAGAVPSYGNVGIGTHAPAGKLHVVDGQHLSVYTTPGYGPTFSKDGLTVAANPDVGYSSMVIRSAHSVVTDRGMLRLYRYDGISPQQEMLYVRMDGNVGIGTLAPGYKLDVAGSVNASGLCLGGSCKSTWAEIAGGGTTSQWSNGTSGTIYYNSGKVGVGTDNPTEKLHVAARSRFGNILVGETRTGGAEPNGEAIEAFGHLALLSNPGSDIKLGGAGAAPRMTLNPAGNVGIGTTAPAQRLHVFGGNVFHQFSSAAASEWGFYTSIRNNHLTSNLYFDGQWKMMTAGKGAFISTAPLDGVAFTVVADNTPRAANALPTFGTLMQVLMDGSVGVGTTTPRGKLEVAGGPLFLGDMGNASWGNMIVRGRVLSSNHNIHLSPPGGTGVFINSDFREAGGAAGPVTLNVSGNITGAGFCIGADCKTSWAQVGGGTSQWSNGAPGVIYYNSGKVGVGTDNPGHTLDVVSGTQWAARFKKTDATHGGILVESAAGYNPNVALSAGGTVKWYMNSNVAADDSLQFWETTGSTPRFTLTQTGNVGIGTPAPIRGLQVSGPNGSVGAEFILENTGMPANNRKLNLWGNAAAGAAGRFHLRLLNDAGSAATRDFMTFDNASGNVGIGTSSPAELLEVNGSSEVKVRVAGTTSAGIQFRESNGAATWSEWQQFFDRFRLNTHDGTTTRPDVMSVLPDGRVGIGVASPATKLHVAGDVTVDGNISAKYQDMAEWVPSTQKLRAGTVVVLDPGRSNHVMASATAYDTKVAGVVSEQPGVILGVGGEDKVKVATTGRVRVRVDATRGGILVGDLLVTSGVEGVAMKSVPVELGGTQIHRPGTIIGKALEPLEKGVGEILVLLSLQ